MSYDDIVRLHEEGQITFDEVMELIVRNYPEMWDKFMRDEWEGV